MRAPTRMPPRALCAPGAYRREPWERTSTRAFASLRCARPHLAGASASRRAGTAERSNGPCGCSAVGGSAAQPPAGCACGGAVAGWHARRSARASCTDSPWLPERRAQRKASSTAHPATDTTQVCPAAQRRGRRLGVAFLLGTFLWRSKEQVPRPPGRDPASALGKSKPLKPPRKTSTSSARTDRRPKSTKTIATSAYPKSARSQIHPKNQSPTSNLRPYCTRLVCFNAFIITFAAGDSSRSDRVMIPNASIWHGIASGNTVTIPCAA